MSIFERVPLTICFTVTALILALQLFLVNLNPIMNITLCSIFLFSIIFSFNKSIKFINVITSLSYVTFVTIVSFRSLMIGNDALLVFRFYLILLLLYFGFYINLGEKSLKIFVYVALIQAFVVIGIYFFMSINYTIDTYLPVRQMVREKGLGDIFSFNGTRWFIQIKGNAVLLIALLLNTYLLKLRFSKFINLVIVVAIFMAGNLAFLIVLVLMTLVSVRKYLFLLIPALVIVMVFLFFGSSAFQDFVVNFLEVKQASSIPIRVELVGLLLKNFSDPFVALFGNGLGYQLFEQGEFRSYHGDIYYELQSVYFLSMLGVVPFAIFVFSQIYLVSKWSLDKRLATIYLAYLLYGSVNPYTFDTLHVIVIMLLNSYARALWNKRFDRLSYTSNL